MCNGVVVRGPCLLVGIESGEGGGGGGGGLAMTQPLTSDEPITGQTPYTLT